MPRRLPAALEGLNHIRVSVCVSMNNRLRTKQAVFRWFESSRRSQFMRALFFQSCRDLHCLYPRQSR